jgi:hypothetical protein
MGRPGPGRDYAPAAPLQAPRRELARNTRVVSESARHVAVCRRLWRCPMLVNLIITLIVVGLLLWLVNNYIPMDGNIKTILNVVVIIAVIIWLLRLFGVLGGAALG